MKAIIRSTLSCSMCLIPMLLLLSWSFAYFLTGFEFEDFLTRKAECPGTWRFKSVLGFHLMCIE